MGFLDHLLEDISKAVNEPAPGQAMGAVFTQFIRDSGAVWGGDAFLVRLGDAVIGARMRNLEAGHEGIELVAAAMRPPSARVLRKRGWGHAPVPPWVVPLTAMPVIAQDPLLGAQTQSDEPELAALAALEPTWATAMRAAPYLFVASDGRTITAQLAPPMSVASVHAAVAAVAALAISTPVALTLDALEDASPTQKSDLMPSVSLAPDGLQVGVGGGLHMVARLGGISAAVAAGETVTLLARAGHPALTVVGGVATLTWPTVERDLGRLRAGVAALRRLAAQSVPYR